MRGLPRLLRLNCQLHARKGRAIDGGRNSRTIAASSNILLPHLATLFTPNPKKHNSYIMKGLVCLMKNTCNQCKNILTCSFFMYNFMIITFLVSSGLLGF